MVKASLNTVNNLHNTMDQYNTKLQEGSEANGAKSGIVFAVSNLLSKGIVFLSIPIFTRIMSTEQIGIVNLYNSWYLIIGVISTLSLTSGGYQLALKEFSAERDQYESSVLSITTIMAMLIGLLLSIFGSSISTITGMPKSLLVLLVVGLIVSPAYDFWMSRQRYEYHYKLSALVSILSAVFATCFSVAVVVFMNRTGRNDTAIGRLWANNAVIYVVSAVFWLHIMIKGKIVFCKRYWKYSLSISIPLVWHVIAKQILDVSDRQMIARYVGNSEVGIYGTIYAVGAISLVIWNAINTSYIPYLYRNIEEREKQQDIRSSSFALLVVYSMIVMGIVFLSPEIVVLFATKEYHSAAIILPPIAIGVSLTAVSNIYSNILVYYKKSKYIMIASVIAAAVNIILNMMFIQLYGYEAAAYTTLVSYIILALIEGIVATRVYKTNSGSSSMIYKNENILFLAIILCIFGAFSVLVFDFWWIRIILCLIIEIVGILFLLKYKNNK